MNAWSRSSPRTAAAGTPAAPCRSLAHPPGKEQTMKRFHVHVAVDDLAANIRFYSTVFGAAADRREGRLREVDARRPARQLRDLEPRREARPRPSRPAGRLRRGAGRARARRSARPRSPRSTSRRRACCYAKSDKYWINDPQGIAWETFHTLDQIPVFGADTKTRGEGRFRVLRARSASRAQLRRAREVEQLLLRLP